MTMADPEILKVGRRKA